MMTPMLWILLIGLASNEVIARGTHAPEEDSLVLVHVLFRHGNRTANGPEELYPNDPYVNFTYPPFGLGQLTNAGKRREYSIGKALRSRYNKFLGEYYTPEMVDARSTDFNRTKMSLQLVLASLFPPRGVELWNPVLNWQPVPYNYFPQSKDQVLMGVTCPNYIRLYNQLVASRRYQAEFQRNKNVFEYISRNTGLNVTTFRDAYNLFFGLATESEWGFDLPLWTEGVWPDIITTLATQEYFVATGNTQLARMASGYLLEKIVRDTEAKINGNNNAKKIYLYSAHENNLAELLIVLGVFDAPHVPTYGSYITFEVHRIRTGYGIKIYYQNYTTEKPQVLQLPGCESMCELNKFISLVEEYFPTQGLCGNETQCGS